MRLRNKPQLLIISVLLTGIAYLASCTHNDAIISTSGAKMVRGTQVLSLTDPKVSFNKSHGNVGWETAYMGGLSILSGRFDTFGLTTFNFDEANVANTNFEA